MSEKSNKSTKKTTKKVTKKQAKKVTKAPAKVTKSTKAPVVAVKNEGVKSPAIFGQIKEKTSAVFSRFISRKDHENFVKLISFQSSSALIYVLLGALTVLVLKPFYGTVSVYFQTRDFLANDPNQQLLGIKDLYTLDLRWVLLGILLVSAVFLSVATTKKKDMYEKSLKSKESIVRWIYIGISSVTTMTFVSLAVGLNDSAVLKMSAGLILATVVLGMIADKNNANSKNPQWLAYVASLITGVLAWTAICGATIGTYIFGTENFAWYMYVLPAVVLLGFIGFAVNQYRYITGANKDFIKYERNFFTVDLLSKVLVFVVLVVALHK